MKKGQRRKERRLPDCRCINPTCKNTVRPEDAGGFCAKCCREIEAVDAETYRRATGEHGGADPGETPYEEFGFDYPWEQ